MDWKTFHQQFTIHPVGQGLFYSCTIKRQEKVVFRMVFDCGSKTKDAGQEEVEIYRDTNFLNEKILDFLVISHFDSDHVNHIGKLLEDGIKVKRVVMPFLTFEERLFLTLKMLEESDGYNPDLDYTARLILDPLTTLAGNLDNDSEAYFIESDPENPISPENNNEGIEIENRDDRRNVFVFPKKSKQAIKSTKGKAYKVKDSVKGATADAQSRLLLMEFLFYRKSIGTKEEEFYKKVKEIFFDEQEIDHSLNVEQQLDAIVERIKKIPSSKKIVAVFVSAAAQIGIPKTRVKNLNTTAICMLHRNLRNIPDYIVEEKFSFDRFYKYITPHFYNIQKFLADKPTRIAKVCDFPFFGDDDDYHMLMHRMRGSEQTNFPNVLLTSDCFLLENEDVKTFLEKYKYYYSEFWLFQIPHHGSRENSNAVLHSNIPHHSRCFINYGTGNTHGHPSYEVIDSLVANGHSHKLFSVNEFQGVSFTFILKVCKKDS